VFFSVFLEDAYYECIRSVYEKLKEENIKKHIEVISLKENKEAVRRFSDFYNRIKLSFYKRIFKKLIRMLN
jgi:hypothetical protein